MADTRTGAPYTHFEAALCDEAHAGCGVLTPKDEFLDIYGGFPPASDTPCPNCRHVPLSHVSVTTADRIAGGEDTG